MKVCDTCGEELPAKMFWGARRRPMPTCTPCRRKEARKQKYRRERAKQLRQQKRLELKNAMLEQGKLLRDTRVYAAVVELNKTISRIDNKIKKYADKLAYNEATARTEQALRHQWRRKEYFEEIKDLLYADAKRGVDRPLEYYLTNTFLLHKHGFPVIVTDADPNEEHDNANS